jgi:hypothetical protein
MWHATFTQEIRGNSQILVLGSFLLAITYVISVQMSHASPFYTYMFQELFNDIRNSSIQWVLTLVIVFWKFESSSKLQLPKWEFTWSVEVHSRTLFHTLGSMKCDPRASLLACTFISPNFGREPKANVMTLYIYL